MEISSPPSSSIDPSPSSSAPLPGAAYVGAPNPVGQSRKSGRRSTCGVIVVDIQIGSRCTSGRIPRSHPAARHCRPADRPRTHSCRSVLQPFLSWPPTNPPIQMPELKISTRAASLRDFVHGWRAAPEQVAVVEYACPDVVDVQVGLAKRPRRRSRPAGPPLFPLQSTGTAESLA